MTARKTAFLESTKSKGLLHNWPSKMASETVAMQQNEDHSPEKLLLDGLN